MAFMLGSFTSGLFGGASDALDLMNKWQKLKQNTIETQKQQLTMNASKGIKTAMNTPGSDQTGTSPITTSSTTNQTPTRPAGPSDITSMPLPKFMQRKTALPLLPSTAPGVGSSGPNAASPSAGSAPGSSSAIPSTGDGTPQAPPEGAARDASEQAQAAYTAYQNLTPGDRYRLTREGKGGQAPSNPAWDALSPADQLRLTREGKAGQVGMPQPSTPASQPASQGGLVGGGSPAQGIPTGTPQGRTAAPQYLPGGSPGGPSQAPQAPAMPAIGTPMAPMMPVAPSLANGTAGIGAQILQTMNPVYGNAP